MIRKFRAPTLQEALEEVRRTFGPDAVVLQTRRGADGLLWQRRPWVEVTAAPAAEAARARREAAAATPAPAQAPSGDAPRLDRADTSDEALAALRRAALAPQAVAVAPAPAAPAAPSAPVAAAALAAPWTPPAAPGFGALAEPAHAPQAEPALAPNRLPACRVIAVMGPSGAGKTTAAASLAGQARRLGRGVRLLVAGAYRPGAAAQLRALARALGVDVQEAGSPGALSAALGEPGVDCAVVDLAAVNRLDPRAWSEFAAWTRALPPDAWRLLAAPAGWHGRDAEATLDAYLALGPCDLILTKCDETEDDRALARLAAARGMAVAFCGLSPAVPLGLRPASAVWGREATVP